MSDEYDHVSRGKLKLKTDGEIKKKKKKKKDKQLKDEIKNTSSECVEIASGSSGFERPLTKAEISFKKMQEKMVSLQY